jgi:subtilisin family serine protease
MGIQFPPIWGLPPDFRDDHIEFIFQADRAPSVWHIDLDVWSKIWDMGGNGENEVIAILDTGVNSHDLLPKLVAERSFISGQSPRDGNSHGTHCAGTAFGRKGIGIAHKAEAMNGKCLSNGGSGPSNSIADAITWAVKEGATIVSMSLGGNAPYEPTREALLFAESRGVLVVAAAGNSGQSSRDTTGWPGRYPETLCIASHAQNGGISNFSSSGPSVDIAFPGSQIVSTSNTSPTGYKTMSGTSMATPYGAGFFACMRSWMARRGYPRLGGAKEWRPMLANYATDKGKPGKDNVWGIGVADFTKIIDAMLQSNLNYV